MGIIYGKGISRRKRFRGNNEERKVVYVTDILCNMSILNTT